MNTRRFRIYLSINLADIYSTPSTGRIYKDAPPPLNSPYPRHMQLSSTFTEFTAWQHDEPPSVMTSDAMKAVAWLRLAEDVSLVVKMGLHGLHMCRLN